MEELSKTQIVLLTLLVSFVTSIATGIVTVALVDQSSAGVGQTIQTVVEKTIETVLPGTKATSTDVVKVSTGTTPPSTPSESDLIVQAVSKNSLALIRIKKANSYPDPTFVSIGLIISKNGTVITDRGLLDDVNAQYIGVFPDGKVATLTPATLSDSANDIAAFTINIPTGEKITPPVLGDSTKLSLGQRVIALAGADKNTVNIGIISSFDDVANAQRFIKTDFDMSNLAYGSILMNLNGEVIGIKIGKAGEDNEYFSSSDLRKELGV